MPFRSTKGASKQRRDQINSLVMQLRALLPLHESTLQRLSQLQVMSLLCVHIRKNNMFRSAENEWSANDWIANQLQEDFMKNLPGFLLVVSKEGKLIYVSDNVTDYLGHSMVDMMTQGDSLFDIVDSRDHSGVQARLEEGWSRRGAADSSTTFFCRMSVARTLRRPCNYREQKVMTVRGQFSPLGSEGQAFVAVCSPLLTPEVKDSVYRAATDLVWMEHSLDLKIQAASEHSLQHLGYSHHELAGRSLYELLHPQDLAAVKELHMRAVKLSVDQGVMLTARLQTADGAWLPVSSVLTLHQGVDGQRKLVSVHSFIRPEEVLAYAQQCRAYNEQVRLTCYSLPRVAAVRTTSSQRASPQPADQALDGLLAEIATADTTHLMPTPQVQFKSTGLALKRKLAEPRISRPRKTVRLSEELQADWLQQDMMELLTELPQFTAPAVIHQPLTPEKQAEDIDLGEILNLPSFQGELFGAVDSPVSSISAHSPPAWLPPSPQNSPPYQQHPTAPLVSRRQLPEVGVNEVIDFFDEVQDAKNESIPTTVSLLHDESLLATCDSPLKSAVVDPRALHSTSADLLQRPEVSHFLLDEMFSESETESLVESNEQPQSCQSLLQFLHEPLLESELDVAVAGF